MDVPDSILEHVFSYLSWNDRARAACVCRRWYRIFQSASIWHNIIFRPPLRTPTKLQYDMKGYRLACCLRAVGSYIRNYTFVESDDMFLLNRTLSLIAKYFESFPKHRLSTPPASPTALEDAITLEYVEEAMSRRSSALNEFDVQTSAEDFGIIGDPDAEATLRLVLHLQEREFIGTASSSSSEEEESELWELPEVARSMSICLPKSQFSFPTSTRRLPYERSQSFRHAVHSRHVVPPRVQSFVLRFHCEVDASRGYIYGTGGALLATIRRVIRQLHGVKRLALTNLFLSTEDARSLILDIHKTAADCLFQLNIVNLSKLPTESSNYPAASMPTLQTYAQTNPTDDWYLLDRRWLAAKPHRIRNNPLVDLASLFPFLTRLIISPTQLSGPMLLRLLYQTRLQELFLVQTEFTPLTISPEVPSDLHEEQRSTTLLHNGRFDFAVDGFSECFYFDSNEDTIDWSGDVPVYKYRLPSLGPSEDSPRWVRISSMHWNAASILRPNLIVQLRVYVQNNLDRLVGWSKSPDYPFPEILSLWPERPCPVSSFILQTTQGPEVVASFLSFHNLINLGLYCNTLTTVVISITPEASCLSTTTAAAAASVTLDSLLCELPVHCPLVKFLALGGESAYVTVMALLMLCRQYSRQRNTSGNFYGTPFQLLIQDSCCCLESDSSLTDVPATVIAWYSTISSFGDDKKKWHLATEHRIADITQRTGWCFLTSAQFQSQVSSFLD